MFNLVLLELKRVGLIGLGLVAGLAVAALVWWSVPAWADDVRVDANLATGLDVSTSIASDETAIQLEGLTIAMQSPEILAAVQNGRHTDHASAAPAQRHTLIAKLVGGAGTKGNRAVGLLQRQRHVSWQVWRQPVHARIMHWYSRVQAPLNSPLCATISGASGSFVRTHRVRLVRVLPSTQSGRAA
jgi:hypothetical protein